MAITASTTKTLIPVGNYLSAVVGIYDIGTQPSDQYEPSHQIIISFELHKKKGPVLDRDGNPTLFNRFVGLGLGINNKTKKPSHLRQIIEAILGRGMTPEETRSFDVTAVLGKSLRISITHAEDGSKEIPVYSQMDEDDPKIDIQSNEVVYELDASKPIPSSVPEWVTKFIQKSIEWGKASKSAAVMSQQKDDSPF